MNKPRDKPDCRFCKHSDEPSNFMAYCRVKRTNKAVGVRKCAEFEERN